MLPRRVAESRADPIALGCVRPGVRRADRSTAEPDVSGAAGAALIERSTGEMLLGPPKFEGRRLQSAARSPRCHRMPACGGDAGGADGMLGGWRSKEISGDSSSRYAVPVPAHPSQLGRKGPGRGEPGSLRGPDACREGTVQGERRHARPGGAVSGGRPQGERHAPAACGQLCQRQGNRDHLRSAGGPGPGFTLAQLALQGMARVRSGQAPAWPSASDRSVRRDSSVKRGVAAVGR